MEEVFEIYQEFVVHSRMYVCTCVCVCAHNDRKEFNTLVVQRNLVKFPAGPKSDRQYAECKQESIPYRLRSIAKKRFNSEMEKAINFPARGIHSEGSHGRYSRFFILSRSILLVRRTSVILSSSKCSVDSVKIYLKVRRIAYNNEKIGIDRSDLIWSYMPLRYGKASSGTGN